jgi:signal transduction histidine kinase
VARTLPPKSIPSHRTAAPDDIVATALVPTGRPWRYPVEDSAPRATVRAAAPVVGWTSAGARRLPLYLAAGLVAAAGVLLAFALASRRRVPPPDVTAEVAHELKTPLTAMRGSLEVALRREREAAEYRETLGSTLEEVKGLQNLVGSVLLLTRGAETPPAKEPVDLVEVVRAEAERVHHTNAERHVSLASVKGPRIVHGDPSLLARAVANLLDNAALHSVAGGTIRARVEAVGMQLIVSVEDDGPGIPASRREKVFERFYRGPDVGRRGIPGAGLGLPIARWIAELHGGSLELDPAVEDRARFVLRLPMHPA